MKDIRDCLNSIGRKMEEEDFGIITLKNLQLSYENFVETLNIAFETICHNRFETILLPIVNPARLCSIVQLFYLYLMIFMKEHTHTNCIPSSIVK
jgi:hypothetical protein